MKIDIDKEVFEFLQKKAQPFVDTPNSVLRKELGIANKTNNALVQKPELVAGIPSALNQILNVIFLIRKRGIARNYATKIVADQNNIYTQTVMDKYCRQLDLQAFEFDQLVDEDGLLKLKKLLKNKFSNHSHIIDDFIDKKIISNVILAENSSGSDIDIFVSEINGERTSFSKIIFNRSNYFEVVGKFLIVKISRNTRPFWGVRKKVIEYLNDEQKLSNYYLTLLVSNVKGWVFNKKDIMRFIANNEWRLAKDRNYKINYNTIQYSNNRFSSYKEFLNLINKI